MSLLKKQVLTTAGKIHMRIFMKKIQSQQKLQPWYLGDGTMGIVDSKKCVSMNVPTLIFQFGKNYIPPFANYVIANIILHLMLIK